MIGVPLTYEVIEQLISNNRHRLDRRIAAMDVIDNGVLISINEKENLFKYEENVL